MPMNESQGRVWKQITQAYQQWDQDRSNPMEINELTSMMPEIPAELIGETLAEALADGRIIAFEDPGQFLPVPNH
ncbi:hypothetical protein [Noviherbaspirillum galbum]|uniref:Uncharacterized protein n=1 Tax=Noviherbaspirillum galbum TaxID=2709383 RepID=A0A6B3SWW0_9BURK|nr:hypothetical protein [Noviherbaspirillum galbum]NEX63975.1 hypothetical protein [Noviherbaspirillum galbum]